MTGQIQEQHNLATLGQFIGVVERRQIARTFFTCAVKVAAFSGGSIPPEQSFTDVQTRDLSPAGVGFLSDSPPDGDTIAFWLGGHLCPIYVAAKIVHRQPGYWTSAGPKWLIGCEFV